MGRERSRYVEEDDDDDDVMMMEEEDGGGAAAAGAPPAPAWLGGLVGETFFGGCEVHLNRRKNEKNVYCLLCCLSICPHCLPSHHSHPLLQVRRYVYHDVVRLGDLEELIDCSYIQPYTINSAKVIFLKQRPQSRSSSCTGNNNKSGSANLCFTCDRILQHPFHFCSLSCKVDHLVDQEEDLSSIILNRVEETSDDRFAFFQGLNLRMDRSGGDDQIEMMMVDDEEEDEEGQITTTTKTAPDTCQYRGSSCSNHGMGKSGISHEPDGMIMQRKKKKGFLPGLVLSLSSRRKGAPHRAPLS